MKKVLTLSLMALALIAFASTSAFACGTCDAHSTKAKDTAEKSCSAKTDGIKASADGTKKSCSSKTDAIKASADGAKSSCSSNTNALKASASGACSDADLAACAKQMGMSVEEMKKMCGEKGSMTMHKISIEGMTCGSCEQSVTKAIEGVSGVNKVVSISYKDANAVVCVDKKNTCLTTLTKTIVDKGYKAEIIPAVATSSTTAISADKKAACSKTCTSAEKAACASKEKEATKNPEDTK